MREIKNQDCPLTCPYDSWKSTRLMSAANNRGKRSLREQEKCWDARDRVSSLGKCSSGERSNVGASKGLCHDSCLQAQIIGQSRMIEPDTQCGGRYEVTGTIDSHVRTHVAAPAVWQGGGGGKLRARTAERRCGQGRH